VNVEELAAAPTAPRLPRGETLRWLRERFEADDTDDCIYLPGRQWRRHVRYEGRIRRVYGVVAEWAYGPCPPDMECCHSCGNGHLGCANRRHVRWATRMENANDRRVHGTIPVGERHGSAKLTEAAVRAIRMDPRPTRDIAADYGVNPNTVRQIINRRFWKHVTP